MAECKQALRNSVRAAISRMSDAAVRRSDKAIRLHVLDSAVYRDARRVFCYYSMDREVSTRELIADAVSRGKAVALPVCAANGEMSFYRYSGGLRPGRYGIMEPEPLEPLIPGKDDLIVVPGLCYDRTGYRLGQGGGYYDRYLARHRGVTLGLCRETLLYGELPREWNDFPMEYVFTEAGVLE